MSSTWCYRYVSSLLAVTLAILALAGCGSKHDGLSATPPASVVGTLAQPLSVEQPLATALDGIKAAMPPPGVDRDTFALLQAELLRVLAERGVSKITSVPPTGDYNAVTDLLLKGNDADGYHLEWTYVNTGDYDNNGLVSISDLTPLGMYFQHRPTDTEWPLARKADGNHDDELNISDITPIGQNWQAYVLSYNVYGAAAETGPWTAVGNAGYPASWPAGPSPFLFELGGNLDYPFYRVVPRDDDGVEGTPSWPSKRIFDKAQVQLGANQWLVEQTVGAQGGVLQGGAGSALEGIEVTFPIGALAQDTPIRLGVNDGSITPVLGDFGGKIIALDTGAVKKFEQPITVRVPWTYDIWDKDIVPYVIDDLGNLELATIDEVNQESEYITIGFFGSFEYLGWILSDAVTPAPPIAQPVQTAYAPAQDGFQVVNNGSTLNQGGECFGYSAFSLWYYMSHQIDQGYFYPRFMNPVGQVTCQNIIVTRAHTSISQQWQTYCAVYINGQKPMNGTQIYGYIVNSIANSGNPVIVYLNHRDGSDGAHAVLAYGYDSARIYIYDPNAPGQQSFINYNSVFGTLGPYGGYDGIYYCGGGSLYLSEPYEQILYDANQGFAANGAATITINSHARGETVQAGTVYIGGYVESSSLLVDMLRIGIYTNCVYDATGYDFSVPANGQFYVPLPLKPGHEDIYFFTYGTDSHYQTQWIWNNLISGEGEFDLNCTASPATLAVTLVWTSDVADLDLVVIDPTGDYSMAQHLSTADGGELAIDDTGGYGPEYWSLRLLEGDTVRWGEGYRVRVHYYDSHGAGGTGFYVKTIAHEGMVLEEINWYPGFFLEANSGNNDPNASGPDWRDVCTIIP